MSTATKKRGATGKFLALLASMTMIIAGLVGVALAAPASAAKPVPTTPESCVEAGGKWIEGDGVPDSCDLPEQVCPQTDGWSSHQSAGNKVEFEFVSPDADYLISEICVKAGSANQGDGPEFIPVDPPQEKYTFSHSSDKNISHFSYKLVKKTTPPTDLCPDTEVVDTTYPYPNDSCTPPTDLCPDTEVVDTTYPYPNDSCTPPTVVNEDPKPEPKPEPQPIVAAAVVEAPAPVAAALPATVEVAAPAPATVNVPAAATVPAAVPAGDGSQAPGLPMWALALIVVGAIGATAAGKQMLGARN